MKQALMALSVSALLSSLGTSTPNVALPTLAAEFNASFKDVQWVLLAYLAAMTISIVAVGRLGDRLGRRWLLLGGIALFTAGSALCSFAPDLRVLVAARAAQGLGAAAMMALTLAFVGETVPKARTGAAMGLLGTMSAVGTAAGPSLGGFLISAFGWQALFAFNVPLGAVALLLAHRYLPRDGQAAKSSSISTFIPLAPIGEKKLLSGLAMNVLVMTVLMATLVVGPFYLSRTLGLDAARVGLVVSIGPIVVALAGIPSGRLVDRFGAHVMTVAGLMLVGSGCALLSLIPPSAGVPGYVIPIAIITAGYAAFQTANNAAVMSGVRSADRGVVSGLLNLSRNIGLMAGVSVMGGLFAATGMRITFAVAAGVTVLAIAVSRQGINRSLTPIT